jgi:hypothetical protein
MVDTQVFQVGRVMDFTVSPIAVLSVRSTINLAV